MDSNEIKIPKRKLASLYGDNAKSAAAINLVYVNDTKPGISRSGELNDFIYRYKGEVITDEETLARIKSLVLPPAWRNVWICPKDNGHLQATGTDTKNRKQYKYHPLWNALRNYTKFNHLYEFGKALPAIREQLDKDLRKQGLPLEKVLAAIVSVMQSTSIRVGNNVYEKLYGSFGLTTLKNRHVTISGQSIKFAFIGKKGVHQDIGLKSKRLANIVKQCKDIPGKELFQYYNANGERHAVDSGMVNSYLKEISGGEFTAKDFRTWAGTLHAIEAFKELGIVDTETDAKKNVIEALNRVAKQLGNTRTVCKKYYVHPMIIDHYTNNTISKYLAKFDTITSAAGSALSPVEQVMMDMLADSGSVLIAA